jgi:phage repressor protein C with HTH and peptisase S24 domain
MASGKDLRKAIKTSDLTMDQAAEKMEVSRVTLYNWVHKDELDDKILHIVKEKLSLDLDAPTVPFIEQRRTQKVTSTPLMVPFIPIKAQAGYVKAVDQEIYLDTLEKYALPPGVSGHGAIWRYWEIQGDSMLPVFREGDIILTSFVHPMDWENIRNFYTYVIVTRETGNVNTTDRVLIKRLYCKNELEWVLISENEELYPQQILPVEYVKEVWVYRRTWAARAEPSKRFEIKV